MSLIRYGVPQPGQPCPGPSHIVTPPNVTSGDATATPAVVAVTVSVPTPVVTSSANPTAAVVATAVSIPPPGVGLGPLRNNTAEGQTSGTALTTANSGGGSGDAYDSVSKGVAGTAAFDSAQFMHGVQSYHVTGGSTDTAILIYSGANNTSAAIRCYIRFNTLPSSTNDLMVLRNSAGNAAKISISAVNKFTVSDSAGVVNTFTTVLSTGVWYRIELECTPATSTTGVIAGRYFLGDSTTAQDTPFTTSTANAGTTNLTNGRFGKIAASGVGFDAWFDDTAFFNGTSTPIGPSTTGVPTPSVVAAAVSVPTPTVSTGDTVTATVVAASTTIPTPVVTSGGNATATPTVVAVVTTVPAPTVQTGSTVTATVVAASVTVKRQTDFLVVVADMQPGAGANPPPTVVAAKVVADNPDYVLMPGDLANDGTTAQYGFFDTMYGSIKSKIYPVPGNHDWVPGTLANYNTYWGSQGGTGNTPPNCYSFDTATGWHVIGIDSDQANVGSVNNPSTTYTFVANDLAANTGKPIIAFWHHPRWSEGTNTTDPGGTGDSVVTQDIWNLLVDYQCDLVFVGHCHSIQRFPKMGKTGAALGVGIREFVVGTGGSGLFTLKASGRRTEFDSYQAAAYDQLNSQFFGYLRLWLTADNYRWQFVSQNAGMLDTGGPVITNVSTTSPTPAVVSAVATVPGPVVSVGVTVAAAVVAAAVSIPTPVASGGAVAAASVVAAAVTVPTPVVSAQQNASVAASVVATAVSIPTPSVSAGGSINIAATVVSAVTVIPAVVVSIGSTVTAGLVVAVTTIPAPAVGVGVTVFAAVVTATTVIPLPTLPQPGSNVAAVVVDCRASIPAPTVQPRSITLVRISMEGGRLKTSIVPGSVTVNLESG